ncbi:RNase H type-1 domain-containing protein [Fusarium sp. Ph1]|nr:RNase H type-1 domain-containing protein [Fusarium sp. Ph1]
MERATAPETALAILGRESPPSIILIADGGQSGAGRFFFSKTVNMDELDRFFASVGLSWRGYCSFITTVSLRPGVVVDRLSSQLPSKYSQSMLFIKKTGHYGALYTENGGYSAAAVASARVGMGRLGYIGNILGNEDTDAVTLALCGLL